MTSPSPARRMLPWLVVVLAAAGVVALVVLLAVGGDDGPGETAPAPTPTSAPAPTATSAPPTEGPSPTDDPPPESAGDPVDPAAAAARFAVAINTYGDDAVDGELTPAGVVTELREQVAPLVTSTFAREYETALELVAEQIEAGAGRTAQQPVAGVRWSTDDAAEVLVAGTVDPTADGAATGPLTYRLVLEMTRDDSGWLVDGLRAVDRDTELDAVPAADRTPTADRAVLAAATRAGRVVLAYDHRDLDRTVARSTALMTDRYAATYRDTTAQLRPTIEQRQGRVVARVVGAGVVAVDGDTAEVLVFANRTTTFGDTDQTNLTDDQVTMRLRRVDGAWLVDDLVVR